MILDSENLFSVHNYTFIDLDLWLSQELGQIVHTADWLCTPKELFVKREDITR